MISVAGLAAAASCLDTSTSPSNTAAIHAVNATGQTLSIFVDGRFAIDAVAPGNVSLVVVTPGTHAVTYRTSDDVESTLTITASGTSTTTVYAYPAGGAAIGVVALDTAATVATGKTKVRVVNLSQLAGDIDVYRTQPDAPTPTKIVDPFIYRSASPYIESTVGQWEVYITADGLDTKLATTDPFNLASGERVSVFLLDIGGNPVLRVIPD
jgi:hypothetical protein